MSTTELITFKFRRGVALQWSNANPILAQGEPGYETDTGLLKMGDGLTPWNSLSYFSDLLNPNGSVALGLFAGSTGQGTNAIAIGTSAGASQQGANSIILNATGVAVNGSTANAFFVKPIRADLTQTTPLCYNSASGEIVVGGIPFSQNSEVKIGLNAGIGQNSGSNSIAIGNGSASTQGSNTIAIGYYANGNTGNTGSSTIAIGSNSGYLGQSSSAIAIGDSSGYVQQGENAIAIGRSAGRNNQPANSIVLNATGVAVNGSTANAFFVKPIRTDLTQTTPLCYNSASGEIVVGTSSGGGVTGPTGPSGGPIGPTGPQGPTGTSYNMNLTEIAIGLSAGISQGPYAIAIGYNAGNTGQKGVAIAIGYNAGNTEQLDNAIAIGTNAGNTTQQNNAIAIGRNAGNTSQRNSAIAIGTNAGNTEQLGGAIAIGRNAGNTEQLDNAIAIGTDAGYTNQGQYSIAIGYNAGNTDQPANSIILNASGVSVDGSTANAFFVKPIRADNGGVLPSGFFPMAYNPTTSEIIYWS